MIAQTFGEPRTPCCPARLACGLLLAAALAACGKDQSPAGDSGRAATLSMALEPVAAAEAPGGYELRIFEDRAYVSTFGNAEGVAIFDVSEPREPRHLGGLIGQFSRSVSLFRRGERLLLANSADNSLQVFDVSRPARPERLAHFGFRSHNITAHPEIGVLYNSRHIDQAGGIVEIVDARDPEDIHLEHEWHFPARAEDGEPVIASGCHDIVIDAGRERAYCAAYEQTLILDIADPWQPRVLHAISNPLITAHHTAFPILDGQVLLINDEFAGNLVWGCHGHDSAATQPPPGAVWFYDLSTPKPTPLSWIGAPQHLPEARFLGPLCTSHNGSELADSGLIAFGWFHAGLMLIDASDPRAPRLLDHQDIGGAVGDARWHREHVFAVDDLIGLTVFRLAEPPAGRR